MFLAWNEIRKNKLRFILITGVLFLVAYLVFFLSGLASGLQAMNREAVDKWKADAVILTEEADKSLYQSSMDIGAADGIQADETAVLSQLSAIAGNGKDKKNVSLFGIRPDEFLMPDVSEGDAFQHEGEVIAGESLKDEGFSIGDQLNISSSDEVLTITGFTKQARFNAAPVLYMDQDTFNKVKYGEAAGSGANQINAVVIKSGALDQVTGDDSLEVIPSETFIKKLPGYSEQNLTLKFMIYFLFIISSVIVAIFLYVLTVQKISMFGIMKAEGISNLYLARSVIAQTFLLAFAGVLAGFVLALVTGSFLPAAVPVSFAIPTLLLYGAVLVIVAIAGAVFSVWTIVRIDPLKAIGG